MIYRSASRSVHSLALCPTGLTTRHVYAGEPAIQQALADSIGEDRHEFLTAIAEVPLRFYMTRRCSPRVVDGLNSTAHYISSLSSTQYTSLLPRKSLTSVV